MSAEELERTIALDERAQQLVDSLTGREAQHLSEAVSAARAEYAAAVTRFAEGTVTALPRPLRGRAVRILAGR